MKFSGMEKTVPLIELPSGHVAIEIFQFGETGFRCPVEAEHAGHSCGDFRNTLGPKDNAQRTMVPTPYASNFAALGHGTHDIYATKIPGPCLRRCEHGSPVAEGRVQVEEGSEALEGGHRQVDRGGRFPLARGIGQLMVAGGHREALCGLFSRLLRAARRHHQVSRATSTTMEARAPSFEGEVGGRGKSTCSLGGLHGVPLKMEGPTDRQEHRSCEEQGQRQRDGEGQEPDDRDVKLGRGGGPEEGAAEERTSAACWRTWR